MKEELSSSLSDPETNQRAESDFTAEWRSLRTTACDCLYIADRRLLLRGVAENRHELPLR